MNFAIPKTIFISYRRDGADSLAQLISDRLGSEGYSVFHDVETLKSGNFNTALYDAIKECTDFVLVLPPHGLDRTVSNEDDWVGKEISCAVDNNKNIIPVAMKGFAFPDGLPEKVEKIKDIPRISTDNVFFDEIIAGIISRLVSSPNNSVIDVDFSKDSRQLVQTIISTPRNSSSRSVPLTSSAIINKDEHKSMNIFLILKQNWGKKSDCRFRAAVYDPGFVCVTDSTYPVKLRKFSRSLMFWFNVRGDDNRYVPTGLYTAAFRVENSPEIYYQFFVTSDDELSMDIGMNEDVHNYLRKNHRNGFSAGMLFPAVSAVCFLLSAIFALISAACDMNIIPMVISLLLCAGGALTAGISFVKKSYGRGYLILVMILNLLFAFILSQIIFSIQRYELFSIFRNSNLLKMIDVLLGRNI